MESFTCANLRCQNGGRCQSAPSGHPQCMCPPGFSGPRCETPPNPSCSCLNGGVCMMDPQKPFSFSCLCSSGYSGEHCQISPRMHPAPPSCPYLECEERRGDRMCDPQCKNAECDWDGGDCTLHRQHPWENCTAPVACWELFRNGRCDPECNNSGCLFDSFECPKHASATPSYCKYVPPRQSAI